MKKLYSSFPRKIALAQVAAAALFFVSFKGQAQAKYPSLSTQPMSASQTLEVSGKIQVSKETRLLDDVYLEKLKDLAVPATQDRLVLIDKFGKMKGGPPFESIPPGQGGGGGNGGGGNPNPQSCSNTFEWEKISGTSNIYNCGFGNVGIGNINPTEKLEVRSGNILIKGTNNFAATGDEAVLYLGDNNHYIKSVKGGGVSIGSFLVPDAVVLMQGDGNVGIGANPSEKLEVNGNIRVNDQNDLLLRNSHHGLGWYGNRQQNELDAGMTNKPFANDNIDGPVLYGFSGGALGVYNFVGKTIALRWDANGNVGIGTDIPLAKLNIKDGSIRIDNQTPNWNTWKIAIETPQGSIWKTTEVSTLTGKYHGFGLTTTGWYWSISDANCIKYPMRLELDVNKKPTLIVEETSWCDFAYDENYKRMTFEEQDAFWKKYKHLFGIASEKEIIENGLDITGTMKGLTLNMEEVRKDAVDLHKRLLVSEQKNVELQMQINELRMEIEKWKESKQ